MPEPASSYDALYLSPHLDDAVLSCGGQIHRFIAAGQRVLIVTLFAGDPDPGTLSPVARDYHRRCGLDQDAMAVRRGEDRAACRRLGADCLHRDGLDALYRRHPETGEPFYPSLAALFAEPAPADRRLVEELAERLRALPPAPRVCGPLAVGRHVDHLLVRRAAEKVWGPRLEYYEDFPYARSFWLLTRTLGLRRGWEPRIWPLGWASIDAKCEAVACYRSQLGTAFRDLRDMRRQLLRFSQRVGGERLWFRSP